MSKFFLVTGTDLQTEEFDSAEALTKKLSELVEEGELSPMDCEVFEGKHPDFEVKVSIM